MIEKPQPKTELVACRYQHVIMLTPNSNDAKQFILKNACDFGELGCLGNDKYALYTRDGYDTNEVLKYFQSYND